MPTATFRAKYTVMMVMSTTLSCGPGAWGPLVELSAAILQQGQLEREGLRPGQGRKGFPAGNKLMIKPSRRCHLLPTVWPRAGKLLQSAATSPPPPVGIEGVVSARGRLGKSKGSLVDPEATSIVPERGRY